MTNSLKTSCITEDGVDLSIEYTKDCVKIKRNNTVLTLKGDSEIRALHRTLTRMLTQLDRNY